MNVLYAAYIKLGFEFLDSLELMRYCLVGQQRLVLPQRPLADVRVFGLGDGILHERLLQLIESHDDAEELGKRVLKIALGTRVGELHLLCTEVSVSKVRTAGGEGSGRTSSRLMVAERFVLGI